jgi:hypothetical protein
VFLGGWRAIPDFAETPSMQALAVPAPALVRQPPAAVRPITRWILIGVFGLFAVGHAWDLLTFQEHWPFSPYKMYALAKGNTHHAFEVWGVLSEPLPDGTTEVKLKPHGYVLPLAHFKRVYGTGKASARKQTEKALNEFYAYYDRLRDRRGERVGPDFKGMRFYKITWTLKPGLVNLDTPDERVVVAETKPGPKARRKAAATATTAATAPATRRSLTNTTAPVTPAVPNKEEPAR